MAKVGAASFPVEVDPANRVESPAYILVSVNPTVAKEKARVAGAETKVASAALAKVRASIAVAKNTEPASFYYPFQIYSSSPITNSIPSKMGSSSGKELVGDTMIFI